jgi:hypothetical protein
MSEDLKKKEQQLQERLERLEAMEAEIKLREKKLKEAEKKKKQILLRIAPTLWDDIAQWAEEDFRSINGQIEYLLAESVNRRKKGDR